MPAIKVTANTSGAALWNAHEHKIGILEGLKIDNPTIYDEKIDLLDAFTTDASKLNSTGATVAAEDLGSTVLASGRVRLQMTVPLGESLSLGKEDLQEVTFLGKAYARGSTTTSDCVVIAQYKLR